MIGFSDVRKQSPRKKGLREGPEVGLGSGSGFFFSGGFFPRTISHEACIQIRYFFSAVTLNI